MPFVGHFLVGTLKGLGDLGDILEIDGGAGRGDDDGDAGKITGPVLAIVDPQQDFAALRLQFAAGQLHRGLAKDGRHLGEGEAMHPQFFQRNLYLDLEVPGPADVHLGNAGCLEQPVPDLLDHFAQGPLAHLAIKVEPQHLVPATGHGDDRLLGVIGEGGYAVDLLADILEDGLPVGILHQLGIDPAAAFGGG